MTSKNPPDRGDERVLECSQGGDYVAPCARSFPHCRRFNLSLVNLSHASMRPRDIEVVPSPLAEQQQEDGQRHRSAGTLEHPIPFLLTALPRESRVQNQSSGFTRKAGFAGGSDHDEGSR